MANTTKTLTPDTILGQPEIKSALEIAITSNLPALLIGETGCGKTSIIRELAYKHKAVFSRFNMTGETSVDEFVGKYTLRSEDGASVTVWQDGMLVEAMKKGHWLVVDEVNVALPEILLILNSLLDDDKFITLANHDGEVIRAHPDFRFFATMNPPDEYAGTKELNKAFLSRFHMVMHMTYANANTEIAILKRDGVLAGAAAKMVNTAQKLRELKAAGNIFYTCSTRDLRQWAKLIGSGLTVQNAYELAICNKAAAAERPDLQKAYATTVAAWAVVEALEQALGGPEGVERSLRDLKRTVDEVNAKIVAANELEAKCNQLMVTLEADQKLVTAQLGRAEAEVMKLVAEELRTKLHGGIDSLLAGLAG